MRTAEKRAAVGRGHADGLGRGPAPHDGCGPDHGGGVHIRLGPVEPVPGPPQDLLGSQVFQGVVGER